MLGTPTCRVSPYDYVLLILTCLALFYSYHHTSTTTTTSSSSTFCVPVYSPLITNIAAFVFTMQNLRANLAS